MDIVDEKTRRRIRPVVGLGGLMTAMAIFGVVMFFFSPADQHALPPRDKIVRIEFRQLALNGEWYQAKKNLADSQIDRLCEVVRDAKPAANHFEDFNQVDFVAELEVRSTDQDDLDRTLHIFGIDEQGFVIEVLDADPKVPRLRIHPDKSIREEMLAIFREAIVMHGVKKFEWSKP